MVCGACHASFGHARKSFLEEIDIFWISPARQEAWSNLPHDAIPLATPHNQKGVIPPYVTNYVNYAAPKSPAPKMASHPQSGQVTLHTQPSQPENPHGMGIEGLQAQAQGCKLASWHAHSHPRIWSGGYLIVNEGYF